MNCGKLLMRLRKAQTALIVFMTLWLTSLPALAGDLVVVAAAGISILLWAVVLVVELSRLWRAWIG